MKLSPLARAEWITALLTGAMLTFGVIALELWWLAIITVPLTIFVVTFFRDPDRLPPTQRGVVVAPADGRVVSVHDVQHFVPFGGETAVCVRIFLSIFNVHVQRSPCHGRVLSVTHKPGKHISVLNPASVEQNEAVLMVLQHPVKDQPVAAIRQIAGSFARTIVCAVKDGQVLQRAQRFGVIKFGSTVELYLPKDSVTRMGIGKGQKVVAGRTVLAEISQSVKPTTSEVSPTTSDTSFPASTTTTNEDSVEADEQLNWEETAPAADNQITNTESQAVLNTLVETDNNSNGLDEKSHSEDQDEAEETSSEDADKLADDELYEYEEVEEEDEANDASETDDEESFEYIYVDEDGNEIPSEELEESEEVDEDLEENESLQEQEEADASSEPKASTQTTNNEPTNRERPPEGDDQASAQPENDGSSHNNRKTITGKSKELGPLFVDVNDETQDGEIAQAKPAQTSQPSPRKPRNKRNRSKRR